AIAAFKVEREPSGTPGFNSVYRATISGKELAKLQSVASTSKWVFQGPATIDPAGTYTLALQKRAALNPGEMPAGAVLASSATAVDEAWAILTAYATKRTQSCVHLDDEAMVPGCTPLRDRVPSRRHGCRPVSRSPSSAACEGGHRADRTAHRVLAPSRWD